MKERVDEIKDLFDKAIEEWGMPRKELVLESTEYSDGRIDFVVKPRMKFVTVDIKDLNG